MVNWRRRQFAPDVAMLKMPHADAVWHAMQHSLASQSTVLDLQTSEADGDAAVIRIVRKCFSASLFVRALGYDAASNEPSATLCSGLVDMQTWQQIVIPSFVPQGRILNACFTGVFASVTTAYACTTPLHSLLVAKLGPSLILR